MADNLPSTNHYNLLAGVNTKASDYLQNQAGFRDLRNLDFFVPNALSKRPGSTQMVTAGTSGPITSLFEFQKLDGASYIIAGSDTAMFYMASNAFTLLSSGWNNGQPTDMLTFQNKLWMANGQKWESWDGLTLRAAGLPCPVMGVTFYGATQGSANTPYYGGAAGKTDDTLATFTVRGIYVAYSYVRSDGYQGPLDFFSNARNVAISNPAAAGTNEMFDAFTACIGCTVPSGYGITGINIWTAVDSVVVAPTTPYTPSPRQSPEIGGLGTVVNRTPFAFGLTGTTGNLYWCMSDTLLPTADLSRFQLYTTVPVSNLTLTNAGGVTHWFLPFTMGRGGATRTPNFFQFTAFSTPSNAFSGMNFCFWDTNTPKFIEQSNNVMFASGFSNSSSVVQFFEVGQPENTSADYNFEVRTNDGDKVTGQRTYNNDVIVTKERSFHKIIGSTPDDLQLVELSTEFGCLSNKTMVEVDQKLMWLDKRGILEFNGSTWGIISTPVEPIFRRMNLSAAGNACAVNHQYRNQVWFGIPIDGSSTNNITVVFDYLVGAWTFFDGYSPASLALVKGALSTPTAWHGDYSGLVHSFGESLFGDNGRGITCLGLPNWEIDQGQQSTSLWRRFFLDVASNSSGLTGSITTRVFSNYDASTVQATFLMYQSAYQSRADFGVAGKSVTAEFAHYSASLPLVIKGFSWTKRFLRNV